MPEHRIRPAAAGDAAAVAELLHLTALEIHERFGGDRDSSLRLLRTAFAKPGNGASREVVRVAGAPAPGGPRVAGAMALFPAAEADARARRFLRLLLVRTPPWTWRRSIALHRLGMSVAPPRPPGSLYVDAIATEPALRRRGVATALLADAERIARERRLESVALETTQGNAAARALYEACGFEQRARRAPRGGLPAFVAYAKRV